MVKVYEVIRKYTMLFMHNNRYLAYLNWVTYIVAVNYTVCTQNIVKFLKYFTNISRNIS